MVWSVVEISHPRRQRGCVLCLLGPLRATLQITDQATLAGCSEVPDQAGWSK